MPETFAPLDAKRFEAAIRRFDEENSKDPNREEVAGQSRPRELLYAERLTDWVLRLRPDASEVLRLAARCQHLCRWKIPRETYPMDRAGYLRWRTELKKFHADFAKKILTEVGYPDSVIEQVCSLNLKTRPLHDAEMQTLEDALCLVFLEFQLGALAAKSSEDKVISALRKSWAKMSEAARAEALKLPFSELERRLVATALKSVTPAS